MGERWTWGVYPRGYSASEGTPALTASGISSTQALACGHVEHVLQTDESTAFGEIVGPGGKMMAARRAGDQIVWRDRWPAGDD